MLVVADRATGELLATGGIRGGALKEGLSPQNLVERYRDGHTGQLVRVYVLREHRRRGIARIVVDAVLERVAQEGIYATIALHTFRHSPGAIPFWLSMAPGSSKTTPPGYLARSSSKSRSTTQPQPLLQVHRIQPVQHLKFSYPPEKVRIQPRRQANT